MWYPSDVVDLWCRLDFLKYQREGASEAVDSRSGRKLSSTDISKMQSVQQTKDQAVLQVWTPVGTITTVCPPLCLSAGQAGEHQTYQQDRETEGSAKTEGTKLLVAYLSL